MKQEIESTLHCLTATNPYDWVDCAHNAHTFSAPGFSQFEVSLNYQSPLFPSDKQKNLLTFVLCLVVIADGAVVRNLVCDVLVRC